MNQEAKSMDAFEAARQAFFLGNTGSLKASPSIMFTQVKTFDDSPAMQAMENSVQDSAKKLLPGR